MSIYLSKVVMIDQFRSISSKLLFLFGLFLFTSILLIATVIWLEDKKDEANNTLDYLAEINFLIEKISRLERDFFNDEVINTRFYEQKTSPVLEERKQVLTNLVSLIQQLRRGSQILNKQILILDSLSDDLNRYEHLFQETVQLTKQRGFKDFGLEGTLRNAIHTLENSNYAFDLNKLLTLRRHEKDFMLRKEKIYTIKLKETAELLKADIITQNPDILIQTKLLELLQTYLNAFEELAKMEEVIGFDNSSGYRNDLTVIVVGIRARLATVNLQVRSTAVQRANIIRIALFSTIILSIVLILTFAYLINKMVSRPVVTLSKAVEQVIENKFEGNLSFEFRNNQDEIGKLSASFDTMLTTVQQSFQEIKKQNKDLAHKQKQIFSSLRYAQQIQQAILPDFDELDFFLKKYFVIYQPRDEVSGDFYWFYQVKEKLFIAVVDCTGHGIPGAFMSMIGNTLLNKIMGENQIDDPAFLLEILHVEVTTALHQEKKSNQDGMDISLCVLEPPTNGLRKITFAGAKQSLFYAKMNGNIPFAEEIRGTRRNIGGFIKDLSRYQTFENHTLLLPTGTYLYMLTDGLLDQQDRKRKKFGKIRFLELIRQLAPFSIEDQEKKIKTFLQQY
ncbi:MAG TPA: hypothetical protein DCM08_13970, partial [Microscillaceae bacterium]|nr:hypothetical protein [Microscillaceae bacterium]